jgi:SNF2 family DNA or RNA helicase
VYPISIKKGRPKFKIMDRKQDLTGPHVLSPTAEIPAPLNKFLRDYQRQGVDFLYRQYEQGMGGILGDDMGEVAPHFVRR